MGFGSIETVWTGRAGTAGGRTAWGRNWGAKGTPPSPPTPPTPPSRTWRLTPLADGGSFKPSDSRSLAFVFVSFASDKLLVRSSTWER